MRARGRTARRLAIASLLALALLAAGVVAPGAGTGGWGQPGAPSSAFGYLPPSGGLASGGEVPPRLPAGTGGGTPDGAPRALLGVIGYKPAMLARLDPRTLQPLPGPRIKLRYGISSHGWSPDGSLLVLGDVDDDVLHLIDPVRLRRLDTIRFGIVARAPQSIAWLGPRRLAVVAGDSGDGSHLLMVDPVAGRVLSRRQLDPAGIKAAHAGDRLVLLRSPLDQIGPALLSVVDDRGRIETVQLPRVRVGFQPPPDWDRPGAYGIARDAALAVDPAGGRAFVVAPDAPIAEVDLASLQVTDRQLRQPVSLLRRLAHWLVPPAVAKFGAGASRAACWLGDGRLAVLGGETRVVGDVPAELRQERRSIGLKLVDARAWTVRPLGPAATAARWEAGRLLTFGGVWDDEAQRERGVGLTVHGPGERQPVHLLGTRLVLDARLHGELVYAEVDTGNELFGRVVVSLRSGRVASSSEAPLPYLLLGDRDRPC